MNSITSKFNVSDQCRLPLVASADRSHWGGGSSSVREQCARSFQMSRNQEDPRWEMGRAGWALVLRRRGEEQA